MRPESYRIRRNNTNWGGGYYDVQGHSRSPSFGSSRKLICDFLLVINSNLHHIFHRFQDIVFDRSKIAIFGYPACVYPPRSDGGVPLGQSP